MEAGGRRGASACPPSFLFPCLPFQSRSAAQQGPDHNWPSLFTHTRHSRRPAFEKDPFVGLAPRINSLSCSLHKAEMENRKGGAIEERQPGSARGNRGPVLGSLSPSLLLRPSPQKWRNFKHKEAGMELGIKQRLQRNAIPTAEPTHPRRQEGAQLHGKGRDTRTRSRTKEGHSLHDKHNPRVHSAGRGGPASLDTGASYQTIPQSTWWGNCRCTPLRVGVLAA